MTEDDLRNLQDNIARNANKKTTLEKSVDLFGNEEELDVKAKYRKIFNAIIKDKNYIFIRGNVVGKKNNYQAYQRWTGLSTCCNAKYDKGTRICSKCGNKTGSGKIIDRIGLNKKAMDYKKQASASFDTNARKFVEQRISEKFVLVGLFFIRKDNRRFDFDNIQTMVNDLLTESHMIRDDDAKQLIVVPLGYVVDKNNPGVIIKVMNHDNYFNFLLNEFSK